MPKYVRYLQNAVCQKKASNLGCAKNPCWWNRPHVCVCVCDACECECVCVCVCDACECECVWVHVSACVRKWMMSWPLSCGPPLRHSSFYTLCIGELGTTLGRDMAALNLGFKTYFIVTLFAFFVEITGNLIQWWINLTQGRFLFRNQNDRKNVKICDTHGISSFSSTPLLMAIIFFIFFRKDLNH